MNESAVKNEDLDEISFLGLLLIVLESWRLLVFGPLVVGVFVLGVSFYIPPTFTAITKFLPPQQQQSSAAAVLQSLGALGGLASAATGIKNPSDQYVAFLRSRSVQEALVKRFDLKARYLVESTDEVLNVLAANTRIYSGQDGLINIEVDDNDPAFSATLANGYVEELSKLLGRLAITEAQQRRVFFEKQLHQAKLNLTKAEKQLKVAGVTVSALKSNPGAAVSAVAELQANITAKEVNIASMRNVFTADAPQLKLLQSELNALRAQLEKEGAESTFRTSDGNDYVTLYREFKYHENLFDLFSKQYELARLDESREGALIQVLDLAQPPEKKAKPKKAILTLISSGVAFFLIILFIVLRYTWLEMLKNPDLAKKINGLRQS